MLYLAFFHLCKSQSVKATSRDTRKLLSDYSFNNKHLLLFLWSYKCFFTLLHGPQVKNMEHVVHIYKFYHFVIRFFLKKSLLQPLLNKVSSLSVHKCHFSAKRGQLKATTVIFFLPLFKSFMHVTTDTSTAPWWCSAMLSRSCAGRPVHLGAAEDWGGLKNRFSPSSCFSVPVTGSRERHAVEYVLWLVDWQSPKIGRLQPNPCTHSRALMAFSDTDMSKPH